MLKEILRNEGVMINSPYAPYSKINLVKNTQNEFHETFPPGSGIIGQETRTLRIFCDMKKWNFKRQLKKLTLKVRQ